MDTGIRLPLQLDCPLKLQCSSSFNDCLSYILMFLRICLPTNLTQLFSLNVYCWTICMSCLLVQNRPFPNYCVSLFQTKSLCRVFHIKMTLICMEMNMQGKRIFISMFSHWDSFWHRQRANLNGLIVQSRVYFQFWHQCFFFAEEKTSWLLNRDTVERFLLWNSTLLTTTYF